MVLLFVDLNSRNKCDFIVVEKEQARETICDSDKAKELSLDYSARFFQSNRQQNEQTEMFMPNKSHLAVVRQ